MSQTSHPPLADGVLVVNLDDRPDRWAAFLIDIAPLLLPAEPERLSAVKGIDLPGFGQAPYFRGRSRDRTWAGRAGCALSHREAISTAAARNWRSVLILEDDVEITPDFQRVVPNLSEKLTQLDWDVCYLGFTDPIGPFRRLAELGQQHALHQIYGCNTTHAYLVKDRAYDFLLRKLPSRENIWTWITRYRAIDRWYARTLSRGLTVLAVSPSLLNQRQDVSDITGRPAEAGHITAIATAQSRVLPYDLAKALRTAAHSFGGSYDALRGIIKRQKGF